MDPKPLVVMLAWVVGCVEQKKRLDERYYLVDLEHVNVAGLNKVCILRFYSHFPDTFVPKYADIVCVAP